jgi:hypothetical protein
MIDPVLIQRVLEEHERQRKKHGPQRYANGTGSDHLWVMLDQVRTLCDHKTAEGTVTWLEVLAEEFLEVAAERDPQKLKAELIQVATVALAWASKLENPHQ